MACTPKPVRKAGKREMIRACREYNLGYLGVEELFFRCSHCRKISSKLAGNNQCMWCHWSKHVAYGNACGGNMRPVMVPPYGQCHECTGCGETNYLGLPA